MQLVWQNKGRLRVVDFGALEVRQILLTLTLVFATALFLSGFNSAHIQSELVAAEDLKMAEQRHATAEALLNEQEIRLRAYSVKLARLQAHIIRLDALGNQLTRMAGLDSQDFSFDTEPAQGGRNPASLAYIEPLAQDIDQSFDELARDIAGRQVDMQRLADLVMNTQLQAQTRPDVHPVASGYISSYFGRRTDPITGHKMLHKGLDYAGHAGTEIVAVADGVVSVSEFFGGFGNFVEIDHGHGIVTRYAHNQKNLVRPGDRVESGQVIALLGSTGRATGPNLHFEVLRDGKVVDPLSLIDKAAF